MLIRQYNLVKTKQIYNFFAHHFASCGGAAEGFPSFAGFNATAGLIQKFLIIAVLLLTGLATLTEFGTLLGLPTLSVVASQTLLGLFPVASYSKCTTLKHHSQFSTLKHHSQLSIIN
jgi:hypothetical protein